MTSGCDGEPVLRLEDLRKGGFYCINRLGPWRFQGIRHAWFDGTPRFEIEDALFFRSDPRTGALTMWRSVEQSELDAGVVRVFEGVEGAVG